MNLERQTTRENYKGESAEYERERARERERERETQFLSLQALQNRGNQKKEQRTRRRGPQKQRGKIRKKKLLVKEEKVNEKITGFYQSIYMDDERKGEEASFFFF